MYETVSNALAWRAAVKVFDQNKRVSDDILDSILEAGRMAPTAYGLQPFRIVTVQDVSVRNALKDAAFGQMQVVEAPHLFVIAARTDLDEHFIEELISLTASTRGIAKDHLAGFRDMMIKDITTRTQEAKYAWAGRQAYIGLGMMLETAALLGVDAGPMEGFVPEKVDEILGLHNKKLTALALVAVGYRGEDSWSRMSKVRVPRESFVITI